MEQVLERREAEGIKMRCFKCNYDWESRKESPKACPRCKTRLDYSRRE